MEGRDYLSLESSSGSINFTFLLMISLLKISTGCGSQDLSESESVPDG